MRRATDINYTKVLNKTCVVNHTRHASRG